ncbi:MAG: hypothetical protein K1X53_07940 [Candidatus Sumerlaeaceae bacterium]|nr:hypothetical protein [Candidatus Sumerlaeaceae bacterium]
MPPAPPQNLENGASFMIVAMMILVLVPFFAPVLLGLLTPGRKGRMRTRKGDFWEKATLEQARERIAKAFQNNGFTLKPQKLPTVMEAVRAPGWRNKEVVHQVLHHYGVHTHDEKVINAKCTFEPTTMGVRVQMELWLDELIIADTGEGHYVDINMTALLAVPGDEPNFPEAPPNPLLLFRVGYYEGLLLALCPIAMVVLRNDPERSLGLGLAMMIAVPLGIVLPLVGFLGAQMRPGKVSGQPEGMKAIILTLFGAVVSAALLWGFHGDKIPELMKQTELERQKRNGQRRAPGSSATGSP